MAKKSKTPAEKRREAERAARKAQEKADKWNKAKGFEVTSAQIQVYRGFNRRQRRDGTMERVIAERARKRSAIDETKKG